MATFTPRTKPITEFVERAKPTDNISWDEALFTWDETNYWWDYFGQIPTWTNRIKPI